MDIEELQEQGKQLIDFYKSIREGYIPESVRLAVEEAWEMHIEGVETRSLAHYSANQRKSDKQRVIRADKAIDLMLEFEQDLVEAMILDEYAIFGRKVFAIGSLAIELGGVLKQHARILWVALIGLLAEGSAKVAHLAWAFFTQDAEKIIDAEDSTMAAVDVLEKIVENAVREMVHLGLKRMLDAYSVASYATTVMKGLHLRKIAEAKLRKAALPQRNVRRYRRRKATNH